MTLKIVGFAGSFGTPSKTRALVELATQCIAARYAGQAKVFDISDLQPALGGATTSQDLTGTARAAFDTIVQADILVVGSPVYKGSYTGLFKHLIDLIDPAELAGKPVLLTATGGGDRHALVIEHQLRPLFAFFEAAVLPTGVYASGSDFVDGVPVSAPLLARLDRSIAQLEGLLGLPQSSQAA